MSGNLNSNLARAVAAWGDDMPDWVKLLAAACDRGGQKAVALGLGLSGGTISRILNRRYGASHAEIETQVRARLTAETVACPIMGEIPLKSCVRLRRRPSGPYRTTFAAVCPNCPFNTDNPDEED